MKELTIRYPVAAFVAYAFVVTWVLGFPVAIAVGPAETWLGWENRPASMLLLKFGPSLAGLLCAWLISGRVGLTTLLKKGLQWRAPWSVVAVALVMPAVAVVVSLLAWSPERASEIFSGKVLATLIPIAAVKILFGGGLGEEFGWRGFMQPQLEQSRSLFTASMIVGVVWIVWHLPAALLGGNIGNPMAFSATLLGYSVILAWIFHQSGGSVLWAAIFHGWANGLSNTYDQIIGNRIADVEVYVNTSYAGVIVLTAGVLLLTSRNRATRDRLTNSTRSTI